MQHISLAIDDRKMIVPNLGDQKLDTVPIDRPSLNKTNLVLLNGNIENDPVISKESTRSSNSIRSSNSVQSEGSSRSNDIVYRIPDRSNRSESFRSRRISSERPNVPILSNEQKNQSIQLEQSVDVPMKSEQPVRSEQSDKSRNIVHSVQSSNRSEQCSALQNVHDCSIGDGHDYHQSVDVPMKSEQSVQSVRSEDNTDSIDDVLIEPFQLIRRNIPDSPDIVIQSVRSGQLEDVFVREPVQSRDRTIPSVKSEESDRSKDKTKQSNRSEHHQSEDNTDSIDEILIEYVPSIRRNVPDSPDIVIQSVRSEHHQSGNDAFPVNKTERHGYKKKGGKSIRREGDGNIILLDVKERLHPDRSVMKEKISNPAISKISEEVSDIKRELDRLYKENSEYKRKYEQLIQGRSNRSNRSSRLSDYSERSGRSNRLSNESARSSRLSDYSERSGRSSRLSDSFSDTTITSTDESINIDNMERVMYNENVVRVIPVKINRQMRFEAHKNNRRILRKLWGELRGKYNHVYNTALQYGMDVLPSRLIDYNVEDFQNDEIIEILEELYKEYSELRESTNNEFRYSVILKGINLFYHLVCMGVSYLWDINTQPILDAILSNMDTHKTLIRQIRIEDFFGDQQEAAPESNERIMMKLLAFIVINVIIIIMLSKFTNLQQYLSFIGGSEKVATEMSESVGKSMTTNSIVPPTFWSSLTDMFSLFSDGQNNQGNVPNNQGNVPNNKRSNHQRNHQRSKPQRSKRNNVDDVLLDLDIEEE